MRLVAVLLTLVMCCPAQVITGVRHRNVASGGGGGSVTVSCVYSATNSGGSDPFTVSGLSASATADLIVVGFTTTNNVNSPTVTDNNSQSYTQAVKQDDTSNGRTYIVYKENSSSGVTQATVSSQGFTIVDMFLCKVTGAKTASSLDITAKASSGFTASTSWSTGNSAGSFAQTSEACFGMVNVTTAQVGSTFAAGTGYTGIGGDSGKVGWAEYQILTTASGQYSASGTMTPNTGTVFQSAMACFKGL
jgi:hypothetical protein